MSREQYETGKFHVRGYGRNAEGTLALKQPVEVTIEVAKSPGTDLISLSVECPYNTGAHGGRCKASHPDTDKVGEGIGCIYSLDLPWEFEKDPDIASNNLLAQVKLERASC